MKREDRIRRLLVPWFLLVGLVLAGMPGSVASAQAGPTDLIITGVIDGPLPGGLPKAVELYVVHDIPDLSIYGIESANNGGGSSGAEFTFPADSATAGDFLYVATEDPGFTEFFGFAPDYTHGSALSINGDDAIVLFKNGAIVDLFGEPNVDGTDQPWEYMDGWAYRVGGTGPDGSTFMLSNWTFSSPNALDGATSNATATPPFPLGSYTPAGGDAAPSVSSTTPANGANDVAPDADITIAFSEPVNVTGSWYEIACTASGTVMAAVSGGPQSFALDPQSDLSGGETCTVTVLAANVSDVDTDDPPDAPTQDYVFTFAVVGITPIHAVQGDGAATPLNGTTVTIEGIVVGDFQGNDAVPFSDLDGFYVQEETSDWDADPATSEGIFVYAPGAADVNPGERVRVTGQASEYSGLTELTNVSVESLGPAPLPDPVEITLPVTERSDFERYEGMLVRFPQALVISEYFNFDRYGEIVLALPLDALDRPYQPTSYVEPADAAAIAALEQLRFITLDDGRGNQNPDPARHPNGQEFTLNNRFRGGDQVQNATGILDDRFGAYRIQPTQGADYIQQNPRPATPDDVGGGLQVASFNVLNYFTTLGSRGADTPQEFERQRAKIIAALSTINADIAGLIELENNDAAIQDLVDGLNDALGAGTYAYIDTGPIGTDEIKVGLIYKPGTVTPIGSAAVLDDLAFTNPNNLDTPKNRPALAQTFQDNTTGGRVTVVVNHLKSKGSGCGAGDDDPQQGNCNGTRAAAADVLLDWLATDPTGSGDPDYLIIGDLNSYDEEDPIDQIKAGPDDALGTGDDYTDLVEQYSGEFAYSYVFDGQFGYLDYGLANETLRPQVTGATEWHINADEPDILDYDTSFKQDAQDALYEPNPYRASDHDPIIIGLDLPTPPPPTLDCSVSPEQLWPPNHKLVTVNATVTVVDPGVGMADFTLLSVTSNEPDSGLGNGDKPSDIQGFAIGTPDTSGQLRAERAGAGSGRVYTLTYQATNTEGQSATCSVTVTVPHDQGYGADTSAGDPAAVSVPGQTREAENALSQRVFLPLVAQ